MMTIRMDADNVEEARVISACKRDADVTFLYTGEDAPDFQTTSGELHGDFDLLKRLLAERVAYTRIKLKTDAGEAALCFPSYLYDYIEDTRARAIHHKIEGSGYVYRECVWRRTIRIREYDSLFSHAVDEDDAATCDIAFARLLYPVDLAVGHRGRYLDWIKEHAVRVLYYILSLSEEGEDSLRREEGLRFPWDATAALELMLAHHLIPREALTEVLPKLNEPRLAETVSMLLSYERESLGRPAAGMMEL